MSDSDVRPGLRDVPDLDPTDGSVVANLWRLRGVWHERISAWHPDGSPMAFDGHAGVPGPTPYETLVYIDFDGTTYRHTNVVLSGRPDHTRSFRGQIVEGILRFGSLGVGDPGHVGVSGGPGILVFTPAAITDELKKFSDPDWIFVEGDRRIRTTVLYRGTELRRVLRVVAKRRSLDPTIRQPDDRRGPQGDVHEIPMQVDVFIEPESRPGC